VGKREGLSHASSRRKKKNWATEGAFKKKKGDFRGGYHSNIIKRGKKGGGLLYNFQARGVRDE